MTTNASLYEGIQLAEGYDFTDQLASPYRLAYGHLLSCCSAIRLSDVNGGAQEDLLEADAEQRKRIAAFSPDGSTLYYHSDAMYAKDLATGAVRMLEHVPQESPFDEFRFLECSPDNHTLVFTQTATPRMVRGSAPASPYRLCRISTDGTDFQVLYEDSPDSWLLTTVCCWRQGFVLFSQHHDVKAKYTKELWKVDLADGRLERVCRHFDFGQDLILHPDSRQVVWSSFKEGLYLCSLENGETEQILPFGTCPAWSPDGKTIAFMNDQHKLCLLDMESRCVQDLIWFEPPNLSYKERRGSYAVQPVWSPDGRMLWFALTQTRKLSPPRSLSEIVREAKRAIYPVLHNLNPRRTSYFCQYRRHYHRHRRGIVDLCGKQILLSMGYSYGVVWLPAMRRNDDTA